MLNVHLDGLAGTETLVEELRDEIDDQSSEPRVHIDRDDKRPSHWEECYDSNYSSGVLAGANMDRGTRI